MGRQPLDLRVEHGLQFGRVRILNEHGWSPVGNLPFHGAPTSALYPLLVRGSEGNPIEPVSQQATILQRCRFLHQYEKCSLERIFGCMLIAQDPPTDPQNHGTVAPDQFPERSLPDFLAAQELGYELTIGPGAERPRVPQAVNLLSRAAARSCRHRNHSSQAEQDQLAFPTAPEF
jgi:hypothetical protein